MSKQSHRSKYTDIVVILGSLVAVGGAISMIHGTKKDVMTIHQTSIDADTTSNTNHSTKNNEAEEDVSSRVLPLLPPPPPMNAQQSTQLTKTVVAKSNEALKTYIAPLISSNNVQDVAAILKDNSARQVAQLADSIVTDKESLLRHVGKVQLILALALNYTNLSEQSALFNIFLAHKQIFLEKNTPILFIAATDLLGKIIPSLLGWAKTKENEYPNLHRKIIDAGLKQVITENASDRLEQMVANGVPINSTQATNLLWAVVIENKKIDFLPLLKQCDANFNDIKNKRTPLITAITNNNQELVKALIDNGASVSIIPSPDTGSALQQAIIQKRTAIELLLREKYHAKE